MDVAFAPELKTKSEKPRATILIQKVTSDFTTL